MNEIVLVHSDDICHHGIKGQKWGVRRFQNEDGTRTLKGKQRYSKASETPKKVEKTAKKDTKRISKREARKNDRKKNMQELAKGFVSMYTSYKIGAMFGLWPDFGHEFISRIRNRRVTVDEELEQYRIK